MTRQEQLDLFNRVTAPVENSEMRYITESGFLAASLLIYQEAFRNGLETGLTEMEKALNPEVIFNETTV